MRIKLADRFEAPPFVAQSIREIADRNWPVIGGASVWVAVVTLRWPG